MMDWPPQSADVNPIKQFWAELEINWIDILYSQRKVFGLSCRSHGDNFSVKVLRKYIDTMPERCVSVIAAKGGHTTY